MGMGIDGALVGINGVGGRYPRNVFIVLAHTYKLNHLIHVFVGRKEY